MIPIEASRDLGTGLQFWSRASCLGAHRSAAGPVRPAVGLALCLHVGLDDPPTRRFSSAGYWLLRMPPSATCAGFRSCSHVVDIAVVDIDVVVTRLAPQLASQLPPRAARAARAWNERRRRPRSPTASTTPPRRRHLALRLSRGARAQSARRSRHVTRSPPLLGAAAAARVARAARVAPPLVGAPFLELDVAPRHEPRRIGARLVNWRRGPAG